MKKSLLAFTAVLALIFSASTQAEEVFELTITADKQQFLYDIKEFTVKAGQSVKLTLVNPEGSVQPHNLLIVKPETKGAVGAMTLPRLSDPEFLQNPVPESDDILFASELVNPGEETVLEFTAPTEPGVYEYLCTYPGHFAVMHGTMTVE